MKIARLWMALAALAASVGVAPAQTEGGRPGKELRILIGSGVGGGYDAYARVAAQFIGKHLPGNPSVVVQNVPGAGGLKLANYMAQIAPKLVPTYRARLD